MFVSGATLTTVSVNSSQISTYDVTISEHDHSTSTNLYTIHVVSNYGGNATVSIPVTQGLDLAAQITSGSGNDISVSLVITQ